MSIHFNPETGLSADDTAVIRAAVAAEWKAAFRKDDTTPELNTEPETPAGQLIDALTAFIARKDAEVLKVANAFNPMTAVGLWQDALGSIYFLQRQLAQATVVTCLCRGLKGTAIAAGSQVEDVNGYKYTCNNTLLIGDDGTVTGLFQCTTPGPVQVVANSITKIVTTTPGWDSVTNPAAGVTGRNAETQAEFEERRYNSVALNSHGFAASVESAINAIPDVVACKLLHNRTDANITSLGVIVPPHSIYLSVYGGSSEEIGNAIYSKLDAGCGTAGNTSVTVTDPEFGNEEEYYYTIPDATPVYMRVTVEEGALYIPSQVTAALVNNFNGGELDYFRVKMGDHLHASRFYQTAITAGLTDLLKIDLSLDGTTWQPILNFGIKQMPTIEAANISFVEATTS